MTINVTNNAPVPTNGNESVLHDRPLSTYVNAYDLDGDNLTYALDPARTRARRS